MSRTIDSILELLREQKGSGAAAAPAAASPAPVAAAPAGGGIRSGPSNLDVYTLAMSKQDIERAKADPSTIPVRSKTIAVGCLTVDLPSRFNYGDFLKDASLNCFSQTNALVQMVWSGVLRIERPVSHTLQASLGKDTILQSGAHSCSSTPSIERKPVLQQRVYDVQYTDWPFYEVEQVTINMFPGFYEIEVAMACIRSGDQVWGIMNTILEMAQSGDRSLKPIPPELFDIRE